MEIGESISAFEINKTFYFKNSKQHAMQIVIAKTVAFIYGKLSYSKIITAIKTKRIGPIKRTVIEFYKKIKTQSVREYMLHVQSIALFTKPTLRSSN